MADDAKLSMEWKFDLEVKATAREQVGAATRILRDMAERLDELDHSGMDSAVQVAFETGIGWSSTFGHSTCFSCRWSFGRAP